MPSVIASPGQFIDPDHASRLIKDTFQASAYRGRRVLVIVPDGTRSGPVDVMFHAIFDAIGEATRALDVLVALGTHPPMTEDAIARRVGVTPKVRMGRFAKVRFFNHQWDDPTALKQVGVIEADEISVLSDGLFAMDVPVEINKRLFEYDETIIIGPVFPHEVVGFSGGNKYLFPGVGGARILNFFHWLGAVVTNAKIIGHADTPVRKVVDRAARMVNVPKRCLAMVVEGPRLAGLFVGTPEEAWRSATELSRQRHIVFKNQPFSTVLSCVPPMYDDLWVGGKGMYKVEPVIADGGEVIIYGPHITEVSVTHGATLMAVGYHCRDYILAHWDALKSYPWGVLAHATHVRGAGTYEAGVERCRVRVTLATGIAPETCARINLGYRDPATVDPEAFADREDEGVLLVRRAGEVLYRLAD
jgi:nickel-dependent lactate racemase